MDDGQQLTPWKVDLMWPLSDGAVVLLSSDAQPSQIIDIRPKIENQNSSKERPSRSMWLHFSKKSAWSIYATFDVSFLPPNTRDSCTASAVWVPASGLFCGASLDLPWWPVLWGSENKKLPVKMRPKVYASRYRRAMGQTIKESKIGNITIPAYFVLNAMLMGTAVHCARLILSWAPGGLGWPCDLRTLQLETSNVFFFLFAYLSRTKVDTFSRYEIYSTY
jgi:hypothetical protein